ncbi:uncharacterized protein LOC129582265 isoform X2 [Paramacrobiotus metropolitanus]|uniref:uncharacterized protein LOC129582265 isoform X2 n=1 Tax=Paramacrobiotus metropolitanus TaxID=2943436 RepID=UPI0024458DCC|nr:uncharacterized protein LOC129582265 isoform X2 [Paramacrobiotus metropolitanus]
MDRRTVGKLSGLEFSNLLHFMLENCHALAISKNDFAGMPYLYMVLFYRSTLSSLERGSFSYLPGLSILSLEAALSDAVHWSIGTRQYLWQLHCSCEYEWFRSWWTSTLIPKLEYISSIQSVLTTTNSDTRDGQIRECYSTWGIRNSSLHGFYMLKRPVRSVLLEAATTADILICFEKEKLYIPVDCSAEPFATRPKDINFAQKNFTINGPVCINETATAAPVLQKRDQNYDSITKAEPKIRIREDWRDTGMIQRALHGIHIKTGDCVDFVKKTSEVDFIFFQPSSANSGSGCQSPVGRQGGAQIITLTPACLSGGIIQHLVLHSLGFFHEHQRPDRDKYVYFNANSTNVTGLFRVLPQMPSYKTAYDLESVMHFGPYDFASTNQPVLLPRKRSNVKMGQRRGLSVADVVKLHVAYNCTIGEKTVHAEPFPEFIPTDFSNEQCALLQRYACFHSHSDCTNKRFLTLKCERNPRLSRLLPLLTEVRKSLHAVTLAWYDMADFDKKIFAPIRRQVIVFVLAFCSASNSTTSLVEFRFFNLLKLTLENCQDLIVRQKDFSGLKRLTTVLFRRSTIQSLEWNAFAGLPSLRVLSLEFGVSMYGNGRQWGEQPQRLDVRYLRFIEYLHCHCQFAQFRSWIKSNRALIAETKDAEVFRVRNVLASSGYTVKDLYFPADCSKVPFVDNPNFFDFSRTEFSINQPVCL